MGGVLLSLVEATLGITCAVLQPRRSYPHTHIRRQKDGLPFGWISTRGQGYLSAFDSTKPVGPIDAPKERKKKSAQAHETSSTVPYHSPPPFLVLDPTPFSQNIIFPHP